MRILKVHNYYLQPGGEDTVFQGETILLRTKGHEVLEYIEKNETIKSMNKASVALQTIWSSSSYNKLRLFLEKEKPDIVHFHNTFPLISPSAYSSCFDLGIPVIQTLDNQRLICPASSFYRNGKLCLDCVGKTPPWPSVLHACYHNSHLHTAVVTSMLTVHRWLQTWQKKVDMFLCSTQFYRDMFINAGLPPEKITVMPHFVQKKGSHNLHKSKEGNYALFIGRLDPEKGIRTLLEAWQMLDIPLKIRGGGQLEEIAKQFIKSHRIKNIEFVERLDEHELSNLIENARFLIMPSEGYYETFGMVIIEAYSRGIPVIASNTGVAPELVKDKKTGLLFEVGNAQDLARKAKWMWDNSIEAQLMGTNGLNEYYKKFTEDICYKTLTEVYQRLSNHK